jgi:putative DNA primase/helicase
MSELSLPQDGDAVQDYSAQFHELRLLLSCQGPPFPTTVELRMALEAVAKAERDHVDLPDYKVEPLATVILEYLDLAIWIEDHRLAGVECEWAKHCDEMEREIPALVAKLIPWIEGAPPEATVEPVMEPMPAEQRLTDEDRAALRKKIIEQRATDPTLAELLDSIPPSPAKCPAQSAVVQAVLALDDHLLKLGFTCQQVNAVIEMRCAENQGGDNVSATGPIPAPAQPKPKLTPIEELYAILKECETAGKAKRLYDSSKLFGRVTDDGDWNDFLAACLRANNESKNGLRINTALLTKRRNQRLATNRHAEEVLRSTVIEMPAKVGIVETVPPRLPLDSLHDVGNAHRLFAYYGDDMRWCSAMKKWLIWDGRRWAPDEMERARKLAMNCMAEFLKQSVMAGNVAAQEFALASLNFKRIKDMLEVMKALVPLHPAQLDTDPMLLNCTDATVHLGTGERRTHRREDYITKLVHHDYRPEAECPLFHAFLLGAMGGGPKASEEDNERAARIVAWLRKAFGYSLTGLTNEKTLFVLFGGSNCGKTTLLATFLRVIEEYSTLLQIDTLMTKDAGSNNAQADLADLRGVRFATTSETEQDHKLAEARIKRLVQGVEGAKIKATKKYENPITFTESHKLWVDGNHLPGVRGSDNAIWNRLCPVRFMSVPDEIDRDLPAKLQREAAGILAWAIAGAIQWRKEGLGRPDEIRAARAEWRRDSEVLKPFFDERCQRKHGSHVLCSDIWNVYEEWCRPRREEDKKFQKLTRDQFTQRLEDIGFKRVMWRFEKEYPERAWEGIALL